MTNPKAVVPRVAQSGPLALGTLIVGAGLVASILPTPSLAFTGLVWCVVGLWAVPPSLALALPMLVLLILPADHLDGLNGPASGFLAFGVCLSLAIASVFRYRSSGIRIIDWDLIALVGVLLGAGLLHANSGELRNLVYWAAAGLSLYWLRAAEVTSTDSSRQLVIALIVASVFGSMFACVETLGGVSLHSLIPRYEPHELTFSGALGRRAAGLSGHPLRLGTLTMLGTFFSAAWMVGANVSYRTRLLLGAALLISLLGLVLSGARGSWLGLVVGTVLVVFLQLRRGGLHRLVPFVVGGAALVIVVWGSGLLNIVYERMFGIASSPGSLNQRFQALLAVVEASRRIPLFGVGFGGANEITQDVGLRIPNLENEYLRFFLAAGWAGPVALFWVFIRRFASARSCTTLPFQAGVLASVAGLAVNVATYNMLNWSIGPMLVFVIAFLALPTSPKVVRGITRDSSANVVPRAKGGVFPVVRCT